MGALRKASEMLEAILGSWLLSLACFVVLVDKAADHLGWQWDEKLLAMILYINFATRIQDMTAPARFKEGER